MITRNSVGGHYPVKKLGEVVDFLDSMRRPVTESERRAGVFPYYGANGIQGTIDDYIFDEPLVLLAEDGGHFGNPERGIAYRIAGKTWVNNHAHVLRAKQELDLGFLCRVLENYDVTPFVTGTTRGKLTKAGASEILIPFPSLIEQRRIAAILDQADALRTKRREALTQLDSLTQSIFIEMFGDPESNPKGWEKAKLGNLLRIRRGGSPRPIDQFLGGTINWIKIGDATNGDDIFITHCADKITEAGLKKTVYLKSGNLIFANCGVSLGFARILKVDGCIHDGWLSFEEIPEEKLDKLFLLKAINALTTRFRKMAPDGTQPNLNTDLMKNFEMILPPVSLQHQFSAKLSEIENIKLIQRKSLNVIDSLFASLQHCAFRGELV